MAQQETPLFAADESERTCQLLQLRCWSQMIILLGGRGSNQPCGSQATEVMIGRPWRYAAVSGNVPRKPVSALEDGFHNQLSGPATDSAHCIRVDNVGIPAKA